MSADVVVGDLGVGDDAVVGQKMVPEAAGHGEAAGALVSVGPDPRAAVLGRGGRDPPPHPLHPGGLHRALGLVVVGEVPGHRS
jgi:hypothetical protein